MTWDSAIHVYAGPSCHAELLGTDLVLHPPAAAGDMARRCGDAPCTIVLIDGYFGHVRSPWHKEILHLMSLGFRMIGAASMGALRAAELDSAGMLGIGAIYHGFRTGLLTGDDEVALVHAPKELRYRPLTMALVDVRAKLVEEVRARRLSPATARHMVEDARAVPFSIRDARCLADMARRHNAPPDLLDPAAPGLKARDALAAIACARAFRHGPAAGAATPPMTVYLRGMLERPRDP
ncbi:TfuA-like protein [Sphingobium sp.]|jgi:hypothetical protein|uniref:TfuA-like protein n=1 Tax=Sphingobium sp. TaxID=1912891 RepID=UPI0035C6BE52